MIIACILLLKKYFIIYESQFMGAYVVSIPCVMDLFNIEVEAVVWALEFALQMGFKYIELKGDAY